MTTSNSVVLSDGPDLIRMLPREYYDEGKRRIKEWGYIDSLVRVDENYSPSNSTFGIDVMFRQDFPDVMRDMIASMLRRRIRDNDVGLPRAYVEASKRLRITDGLRTRRTKGLLKEGNKGLSVYWSLYSQESPWGHNQKSPREIFKEILTPEMLSLLYREESC